MSLKRQDEQPPGQGNTGSLGNTICFEKPFNNEDDNDDHKRIAFEEPSRLRLTRNARHGWVPPFLMGLLLPVIISELSRIWRRRTPRPRHTAHTYNQTIVRLFGVVVPYSAGLQHQHQVGRTRVREVKGCHYAQAGCSRLVTGTCVTRFCFAVAVCPEALIRMNAWSSQLGGQQSAKQGK